MSEINFPQNTDTPFEDYLYLLGSMKADGKIKATWDDISILLNRTYNMERTGDWFRKHYSKMENQKLAESIEPENIDASGALRFFNEIEKKRLRIKDERISFQRSMREEARRDELFDLFVDEIHKFEPNFIKRTPKPVKQKAIYVMLSDVHYGIEFDSSVGKYSPELAQSRVMTYAEEIIRIGEQNGCSDCYVSLMGDMISGNIHNSIRLENRSDVVQQTVKVSELVADFIKKLSDSFNCVFVNSVSGNHSRIDQNLDNTLRGERLDWLVYFYCKVKFSGIGNVYFVDNQIDSTIGLFEIYGKNYVCVHGDMDSDMKLSATRIQKLLPSPIYALLLGHMHVASLTYDDVLYLRNGSVCGSGDDYTVKKRLFAPPTQVCFIVNEHGLDGYYPINLDEREYNDGSSAA